MTKKTAVAIGDPQSRSAMETPAKPTSPMEIISKAVEGGTDVEVLNRMFDLYERDQARIARVEFDKAMAKFQGECPSIPKSKKADRYTYAPIEEIMRRIQPALTANGLSVRFDSKFDKDGYMTALCTVGHSGGHKETSEFICPVDKDNKTKINVSQQAGSANAYAKRYALGNALNLTYGDDDDGEAAGTKFVNKIQASEIETLISEKKVNEPLFFKWVGASSYKEIPASWYDRIMREYS